MEREYIGVDLHKAFFQACAIDQRPDDGCGKARFQRTPEGIGALRRARWPSARAIAVEASGPTWALVDTLVADEREVSV